MKKEKTKRIFIKIGLVLLLAIYVVAFCPVNIQSDTLFDIKCGEVFVNEGLKKIDDFSIHEGLNYQSHHIIPSIIIYYLYSFFDFIGLHIFEIILTLIIATLFYRLNTLITNNKIFSYLAVYLEIAMFDAFISLRAQMFSTIIFLVQLILINILKSEKISKKQKWITYISLGMLPMILVNFHAGVWPFYYIIMGVYFISALIRKNQNFACELISISAIAMPFMLINPYGIDGMNYVLKTLGNTFISENVLEFKVLSLESNSVFFISIISVLTAVLVCKKKKTIEEILFLFGTMFMAFCGIRHYIFFVICFPILLRIFTDIFEKVYAEIIKLKNIEKQIGVVVFSITYLMINLGLYLDKSYEFLGNTSNYPKEAVNYIKENIGIDKRILNSYNYGSYMMFEGIKVFVDNRADLYTKEYNNVTIAQDGVDFSNCEIYYMDVIEKYDIEYVFVESDKPVVEFLKRDVKFELLFEGENSVIFKYNK